MTKKQSWLLDRLLIPAGILPPGVKYEDLHIYEQLRKKIGNVGFEYFYMIKQDGSKINSSRIGKKIIAMHAPWPNFGHNSLENPLLNKIANLLIYQGDRLKLPTEFNPMADNSFEFAKEIGARLIVFHISFFNPQKIGENLAHLVDLEGQYNITAAIEPEGPHFLTLDPKLKTFPKIDGSHDWTINPAKLIRTLDKFSPKHKFKLCLDTASLLGTELPVVASVKPVINRICHLHLATSPVGRDTAGEIDRPEIVEVVELLYAHKYSGFITAEVNGAIGPKEELLAKIYGASTVLGFPILKDVCISNAQKHIYNSCRYLLNHLT